VPLRLEEIDCSSVQEAVRKDHFGCLKLLLAKEPAAALQLDEHGETPLHCVEHTLPRCHAVTAALLRAQPAAAVAAVINAVDRQQRTALQRVVHLTSAKWALISTCVSSACKRCALLALTRASQTCLRTADTATMNSTA
jgi:hypothetical protein